jgi:uncharacterized protein YaaN involved in tellurite resistance
MNYVSVKEIFFQKMFGKVKQSIYEITTKYQKIGAQIDKIATKLNVEKDGLLRDNQMLETLYNKNKDYFDALNILYCRSRIENRRAEAHNDS